MQPATLAVLPRTLPLLLLTLPNRPLPRLQVADVGCGCGEALMSVAAAFPACTCTGYDIAEDALRCVGRSPACKRQPCWRLASATAHVGHHICPPSLLWPERPPLLFQQPNPPHPHPHPCRSIAREEAERRGLTNVTFVNPGLDDRGMPEQAFQARRQGAAGGGCLFV